VFKTIDITCQEAQQVDGQEAQQIDVDGNASIVDVLLYDGDDASLTHLNVGGFDQALTSVSDFDLMKVFEWSSCWTDSTYSTT